MIKELKKDWKKLSEAEDSIIDKVSNFNLKKMLDFGKPKKVKKQFKLEGRKI